MTVTDQLKIIDNKRKANQAQYDLDRLASKISAYSSGDLKNISPQTKTNENLREKVWEMLEIFSMNCITFTKINTTKK